MNKPKYVKSSLTPGSKVVTDYLSESGLLWYLEELGFHVAGYGCATCIGNSGPLAPEMDKAIEDKKLIAASVLSGNRNFEGRIHPQVKANYLASPPLVVIYALAGTVNIDLATDPLGLSSAGNPIFFKDLWPSSTEVQEMLGATVKTEFFQKNYQNVEQGNNAWNQINIKKSSLYNWSNTSTYIQNPPFLDDITLKKNEITELRKARIIAWLGDTVTTDHLSPSGAIRKDSHAGEYLKSKGVDSASFNSYPSRRGNHHVMLRGALANPRIRNKLVPGTEGGQSIYYPTGEIMPIYDVGYKESRTPLIILAGKEYGTGSSRDWAAKGPQLFGVKIVIAESFERIHRSNLVGMGILPLQFEDGVSAELLNLNGDESFETIGLNNTIQPGQKIRIKATNKENEELYFNVILRLDNKIDIENYKNKGILPTIFREILQSS